jgi:pimeloyl-ACP methyl ester carboxylesterase
MLTSASVRFAVFALGAATCSAFTTQSRKPSAFVSLKASSVVQDPTFSTPDTSTIDEVACKDTANRMQRVLVPVSSDVCPSGEVGVSYVHWPAEGKKTSQLPLLLLHGFDSSCLEYRRLGSKLAARGIDAYAVDLLGWGFTQLEGVASFSAASKVETLESFAKTVLDGTPFAAAGASLGGASAIELAAANPDLCAALILIDAQGFVDGVGPMAALPKPIAQLGVQVLKSVPLRQSANKMSYFDPTTFATDDAMRIGRLHCTREGWSDALVSFMLSGGFSPSLKVAAIEAPALVLWGRQDGILDGKEFANKFVETLPNAELRWIEECGHVPHLEKPDETADAIAEFLSSEMFKAVPLEATSNRAFPFAAVGGALAGAAAVAAAMTAEASTFF